MKRHATLAAPLLAALVALPLLHGCGGSLEQEAYVRLVNATNNYSALDIVVDDSTVIGDTAASTASSYATVDVDDLTFELRSSGSSTTAASATVSLDEDSHHTLLAYYTGGSLQMTTLSEDESAPSSGKSKLKILNAASGEVDSVDVYLTSADCSSLSDTDTATFSAVSDVDQSFNTVTAGSYNLCVTGNGDPTDLRLALSSFTLTSQQVVTLALTRSTGGTLLNAMRIDQQGTVTTLDNPSARVRLVADAAGAATVSATVNSTVLSSGTISPSVGAYKLVDAGTLTTTLTIDGTSVSAGTLSAASGADLTLLVAGSVASPTLQLISDSNLASTSSSKPVKIRLVNGLNGASGTMQLTVDGDVVADGTAFGAGSTAVNVAASSASATLDLSLAGSVIKSLTDVTLTSGRVYTLFALGDASGTVTTVLRADH